MWLVLGDLVLHAVRNSLCQFWVVRTAGLRRS